MMEPSTPINFPDGPPIPEMREALLTDDNVRELINDLAQLTRVISVQCKSSARTQTPMASDLSLDQAANLLLSGNVQAIQVRYCHDDFEWTDTLMRFPTGIRMVRCRHEPN